MVSEIVRKGWDCRVNGDDGWRAVDGEKEIDGWVEGGKSGGEEFFSSCRVGRIDGVELVVSGDGETWMGDVWEGARRRIMCVYIARIGTLVRSLVGILLRTYSEMPFSTQPQTLFGCPSLIPYLRLCLLFKLVSTCSSHLYSLCSP